MFSVSAGSAMSETDSFCTATWVFTSLKEVAMASEFALSCQ